ncbi:MAG: PQQ-dependent sugar dehydrogenase [Minwuia sp.]|nr:PQQ-dependent sugar dehydrogenase [Minwuia sp.]
MEHSASRWNQISGRIPKMGLALVPALFTLSCAAISQPLPPNHQPVGQAFHIRAADLPPPYATDSIASPAYRVDRRADATLKVPPGFRAELFATGLSHPRWMAVAPNGDVLLAESRASRITLLRDADGDGKAEIVTTFADALDSPHGMAIREGWVYVAEENQVRRLPYRVGDLQASGDAEDVTGPRALGNGGGHWTRNLVFSPDGSQFHVAVGSRGNIQVEAEPRATVQQFNADGSGQKTFATGLRNPVGIAVYPGTNDVYVVVNERDGLGDGLVPDYLTRVQPDGFYGWPFSYIGANPDPSMTGIRDDLVDQTIVPDVLFKSHSAPIGLVFYTGAQFPADYSGDAFVALRGSWNAATPTGYKIVRVPFRDGRPVGSYSNFATGFWVTGPGRAGVIGRPAGLAVWNDGSLLVADDTGRAVWRISYVGK